jgi:hypothetical protein
MEPLTQGGISMTLLGALDPAKFAYVLVRYPADYGDPIPFGESNLIGRTNAIKEIAAAPGPVMLTGYSAGSFIAGDLAMDIVNGIVDGIDPSKLVAVALLADPKRPEGAGVPQIYTPGGYGIAGQRDITGVPVFWGTASMDPIAALDGSNPLRTVADLSVFASIDPDRWETWALSIQATVVNRSLQPAWKFWLQPWMWVDAAHALDLYIRLGGHTDDYLRQGICTALAEAVTAAVSVEGGAA